MDIPHKRNIIRQEGVLGPVTVIPGDFSVARLAAMQGDPDIGYIVDAPHADAPLIITFGFAAWDKQGSFDFDGRTRKLAAATDQPLNRILIRDTANLWYQHGVTGLGRDVDSMAVVLNHIIADIRPTSVCTIGQSMGAYAAILFGALLDVDRVIAFGPLSHLRSDQARRDGDARWLAVMEKLDRYPPARRYDDLPALLRALARPLPVHVVFGSGPDQAGNLDLMHARRLAQVPGVTLEEFPDAPHAVVQWLIDARRIDDLLKQWWLPAAGLDRAKKGKRNIMASPMADTPLPADFAAFNDGWRVWIAENLAHQAAPETLLAILVSNHFHPGEAQLEIDKAERSPYLKPARLLAQRVAKRDWSLEVQRKTRRLATAGGAAIDRRHRLGRADFLKDHYAANRPVVITGMMDDWPAMRWTPQRLADRFADRIVQVQAKRNANPRYEIEAARHHESLRFGDFMGQTLQGGESNDLYMTASNGGANASSMAELWNGIIQVPEYLDDADPANRGYFWIGPAGTVTPTHHDLTNNFMAQIMGKKRVHLVDGLLAPRLYNHLHVYSEVDLEAVDYDRFPLMRDVEILCYDLMPGELLFIPVGWWHHVRALDFSVTVTFTNFLFDNDFHSIYGTYGEV